MSNSQKSSETVILTVKDLTCIAKSSGVKVVDNVSFSIAQGETVGLLGESGVGKTTLFRAILQLLPTSEWHQSGEISIGDIPVMGLSPKALEKVRGRLIRCIFQEPGQSLNPSLRIERQLKEAIKTISPDISEDVVWQMIMDSLTNAGLADPDLIKGRYPGELSGGQRQRVGIAMSLSSPCSLLLADEPSNSLDSVTVTELVATLVRLKQRAYLEALFCVTHDLSVLGALECERVLFMDDGQMFEAGSITDVLSNPCHEKLEQIVNLSKIVDRHGSQEEGADAQAFDQDLVTIKDLTFGFPRKSILAKKVPPVIRNVNIEIKRGEFVALVGSSGSGKSTIGSVLARLLPNFTGDIIYEGKKLNELKKKSEKAYFHRQLQVVFQDPADTFDPALTMRQNIVECYRAMGLSKMAIEGVFPRMMEMLLLEHRTLDEIPNNLSGGQKQRFALLRAFGAEPAMIIADEPFTHLDLIAQSRLIEYLLERKNSVDNPMSCILISHEIGIVSKLCDRIVVIDDGLVVEDDTVSNIVNRPEHPATRRLIDAANMLGTLAS
jgi:peptide/nickel transport system ATP-binding protein